MKAVLLHGQTLEGAGWDEKDVFVQVAAVSQALADLGYEPVVVPLSLNIAKTADTLLSLAPAFIFNLVEAIEGKGNLIHFAPAILDTLCIPYTGSLTTAMFLTSHKVMAKQFLRARGIATPAWLLPDDGSERPVRESRYIVKSVWEHASIGLDEGSVIAAGDGALLRQRMNALRQSSGGDCFAEAFVEGREINISLLAGKNGPDVLPPAEILFEDYPPEKLRVLGYRAKWVEDSFEYQHTPRTFNFPEKDEHLLTQLTDMATRCWQLFNLQGYARVDFRVDQNGKPWVLEVNANPCLSPKGGYIAAANQAGLSYNDMIERIIRAVPGMQTDARKPPLNLCMPGSGTPIYRREVLPSDREQVRNIVAATGFFSAIETDIAVELVEETLTRGSVDSGYFFLFAEEDGEVIGYTCFGPILGTMTSYDLYWIVVHPRFHRRGVGRELLAQSERLIFRRGGRRIYIDTSSRPQYEATRAFYRAQGYREDAFLQDFYAPGDGKIIYAKAFDTNCQENTPG